MFERNVNALAAANPHLSGRLRSAANGPRRYSFRTARSNELVPLLTDSSGAEHPLHSTVDPCREAQKLIASLNDGSGNSSVGFLVLLGLGGGFASEAAINNGDIQQIIIIDYDISGIAELLHSRDYTKILGNSRCVLLIDPSPQEVESIIIEQYLPSLHGAIKVLPLRPRTAQDQGLFNAATIAIESAIEKVSADYSVQAHFGMRWFCNIVRNLRSLEAANNKPGQRNILEKIFNGQITHAAICAAGPSLDLHIPLLAEQKRKNRELFIIAADTSLPALLRHKLRPDAVVSIDCQHISYYHFIGLLCRDIPLFLDIASPPLLSRQCDTTIFCGSSHPLSRYISLNWQPLPEIDSSGGNVAYVCLSLAQNVGAKSITVYGADFSYPRGKIYARGTYVYPFFEKKQNRLSPLESKISGFLYRSPFLAPTGNENYYETSTLRFYREKFIDKAESLDAHVSFEPGMGPPILLESNKQALNAHNSRQRTGAGHMLPAHHCNSNHSAIEFLEAYKKSIEKLRFSGKVLTAKLPVPDLHSMNANDKQILYTLLPLAAAIKHRQPSLDRGELFQAVKEYCVGVLSNSVH